MGLFPADIEKYSFFHYSETNRFAGRTVRQARNTEHETQSR